VAEGVAERFIAVDMRDADTVFERTLEEIKARPSRAHTHTALARSNAKSRAFLRVGVVGVTTVAARSVLAQPQRAGAGARARGARPRPRRAPRRAAPAPRATTRARARARTSLTHSPLRGPTPPLHFPPAQKLEAEGLAPDGVCTFNEMSVPIAARLAEALNLPGNPVAAVDAARDKFATRAIMADAGLATPANCLIEKADDLVAAAATVGFPAVIKPIAGAGSMGVVRVDSAEELARIYKKVVADMGRAVVTSGALVYAPESGETGASTKARRSGANARRSPKRPC
jgi:hypothetical protein